MTVHTHCSLLVFAIFATLARLNARGGLLDAVDMHYEPRQVCVNHSHAQQTLPKKSTLNHTCTPVQCLWNSRLLDPSQLHVTIVAYCVLACTVYDFVKTTYC